MTEFKKDEYQNSQNENSATRIDEALAQLRYARPDDRSELDRRYAIAITDLEKVRAYVSLYIVEDK